MSMGIYLPNVETPTSCDKCVYSAWSNFYQIYVCNAVRENEPVLFDGKQIKSTAVARSARADNCPLVPVPSHGRLGDLDELYSRLKEWYKTNKRAFSESEVVYIRAMLAGVKETLTIIPAEDSNMDSSIRIFEEDDKEDGMDSFIRILKD